MRCPEPPGLEPPKDEPPTPAEKLIDEAKARVARIESCSADLEQTVKMLDQRFTIKGNYIKAPGYRVYFRLALAGLPDTQATSLQICDGETFWRYQSILDQSFFTKLSIKPVMERINSPDLDPKYKEYFLSEMGFAGPESLLVGVRRLFRFEQEKEESKLGDKAVWILRGTWKSRNGLSAGPGRPVPALGLLPPYIPSDAVLYLGKDDGWPYKLTLQGRAPTKVLDTRKEGPDGRKIGSLNSIQSVAPTNISLVYSNVKLNPPVNREDFVFQTPNSAPVEDGTEMIVNQLDQALRARRTGRRTRPPRRTARSSTTRSMCRALPASPRSSRPPR